MELALQPRGPAMQTLVELAEREQQLRGRIDEVEHAARSAGEELVAAREALIALEAGEPTTPQRKQAEARLAQAAEVAAQPWRERVAGAERAASDAHHAVQV